MERLRALPAADEASNKEWQRSKLLTAVKKVSGTTTGHNGAPRLYNIYIF